MGRRIYPQFYVDISKVLPQKREMLARHVSQREWLRSHHGIDEYLDRMTAWAAGYGSECGFAYAEGFRQHLGHGLPARAPLAKGACTICACSGRMGLKRIRRSSGQPWTARWMLATYPLPRITLLYCCPFWSYVALQKSCEEHQ